tara:strand:+ start:291 stop:818 length:528 start_codon:yes stop_codon:yes gene_type:complete
MKPKFLKNPKTDTYKNFKNLVLSADFSWFRMAHTAFEDHQEGHEDFPFLSHRFLTRPLNSCLYSKVNSSHVDEMQRVFREIAFANDIDPQVIYRMNANAVYPTANNLPSPLHVDHNFPHNNMIIYLTDLHGGSTMVEGKEYMAQEDDVLIFDGKLHCARPPRKDVRIVLVITFLL